MANIYLFLEFGRLTFLGRTVHDESTLGECGVYANSCILEASGLCGGKPIKYRNRTKFPIQTFTFLDSGMTVEWSQVRPDSSDLVAFAPVSRFAKQHWAILVKIICRFATPGLLAHGTPVYTKYVASGVNCLYSSLLFS